MRPIRLTMTAFGPYAGTEVVDFREATDAGLFGIYGATGSTSYAEIAENIERSVVDLRVPLVLGLVVLYPVILAGLLPLLTLPRARWIWWLSLTWLGLLLFSAPKRQGLDDLALTLREWTLPRAASAEASGDAAA